MGVLAQFKLKPKVLVAQYDAVAIERIKAEWMQSPLWLKDYHILLNGIQSLQNDNNMLRRNLLKEGEIGTDASFKQRRLRNYGYDDQHLDVNTLYVGRPVEFTLSVDVMLGQRA